MIDDKEDHYIMSRHMFSTMKRGVYQLDWCATYQEAIVIIQQKAHDVYLVDYQLGLESGIDLIREARAGGCRQPMIIFTSGDNLNVDLEALSAGATDYLAKGRIDATLLERSIHYGIQHTRQIEALRESQHFTQTIIAHAGEGLIVYDADLRCTTWNKFMEDLTGIPASEVMGPLRADIFRSMHGEEEPEPILERVLAGETICLPDMPYTTATGRYGWASCNFRPLIGADSSVIGVVETFHDNTERKQAEEALRASEERLSVAINAAAIGTADWHIPTNRVSLGGYFASLMNIDPLNPPQTFDDLLTYVHPEDQKHLQEALIKAAGEGAYYQVEFRVALPEGGERWLSVQGQVYHNDQQQPVRMSGVLQDITERRQLDQQRADLLRREQEARRLSEQANAMKVRFLAMISHELRTPLTSIKGFTSTLLAPDVDWTPDQYHDFMSIIDDEADKLTDLVAQLIDISRLTVGALPIQTEPHMLSAIVRSAMPQIEPHIRAHSLETEIPNALPWVMVDQRRIEQVIVNLVENASKYSPAGTNIRVSAAVQDGQMRVEVDDEGDGIPIDQRESVFEAFHRANGDSHKGAGLGLAICKGLIEAHGGRIWIEDKQSPGTRIVFTLELAPTDDSTA